MYIPTATSVAECINADAGNGASIESGNQKWKPICADLMKEATNIKKIKTEACGKKQKDLDQTLMYW